MNLLQIRKVQRFLWAPGWIKGYVSAQNLQLTQSSLAGGGGISSQQPIFALSLRILHSLVFCSSVPHPAPTGLCASQLALKFWNRRST